jgi:parallel beta-helix repeat protein
MFGKSVSIAIVMALMATALVTQASTLSNTVADSQCFENAAAGIAFEAPASKYSGSSLDSYGDSLIKISPQRGTMDVLDWTISGWVVSSTYTLDSNIFSPSTKAVMGDYDDDGFDELAVLKPNERDSTIDTTFYRWGGNDWMPYDGPFHDTLSISSSHSTDRTIFVQSRIVMGDYDGDSTNELLVKPSQKLIDTELHAYKWAGSKWQKEAKLSNDGLKIKLSQNAAMGDCDGDSVDELSIFNFGKNSGTVFYAWSGTGWVSEATFPGFGITASQMDIVVAGNHDKYEIAMELPVDTPSIVLSADGQTSEVRLPSCYNDNSVPGAPSLPMISKRFLIPYGQQIDTVTVTGESTTLDGTYVVKWTDEPEITGGAEEMEMPIADFNTTTEPNATIYSSSEPYPGMLYKVSPIQIYHGHAIVQLMIYPIQYTPSIGTLDYYANIDISVNTVPSTETPMFVRGLESDIADVGRVIENADIEGTYPAADTADTRSVDPAEQYDYVIITNEYLDEAYWALANYKSTRAVNPITATVVTVENITKDSDYWNIDPLFNDTQCQIREFIKDAYANWDTTYVVLGSDAFPLMYPDSSLNYPETLPMVVPVRKMTMQDFYPQDDSWENFLIPSDMYYAGLDGNWNSNGDACWGEPSVDDLDMMPEMLLGRVTADTPTEVGIFLNKVMAYEQANNDEPDFSNFTFMDRICIAGEPSGIMEQWIHESVPKNILPLLLDEHLPTGTYNRSNVMQCLENSSFAYFSGHGGARGNSPLYWWDVWSLENQIPFIFNSDACYDNSFDNYHHRGDGYIDLDVNSELYLNAEYAAVAFIGNTRYGWVGPSEAFSEGLFNSLFNERIYEIANTLRDSKLDNYYMFDRYSIYLQYSINLLGDPEMTIKIPNMPSLNLTVVANDLDRNMAWPGRFSGNAEVAIDANKNIVSLTATLVYPDGATEDIAVTGSGMTWIGNFIINHTGIYTIKAYGIAEDGSVGNGYDIFPGDGAPTMLFVDVERVPSNKEVLIRARSFKGVWDDGEDSISCNVRITQPDLSVIDVTMAGSGKTGAFMSMSWEGIFAPSSPISEGTYVANVTIENIGGIFSYREIPLEFDVTPGIIDLSVATGGEGETVISANSVDSSGGYRAKQIVTNNDYGGSTIIATLPDGEGYIHMLTEYGGILVWSKIASTGGIVATREIGYAGMNVQATMDSAWDIHIFRNDWSILRYSKIDKNGNAIVNDKDLGKTYSAPQDVVADEMDQLHLLYSPNGKLGYIKMDGQGNILIDKEIAPDVVSDTAKIVTDTNLNVYMTWLHNATTAYFAMLDDGGVFLAGPKLVDGTGTVNSPNLVQYDGMAMLLWSRDNTIIFVKFDGNGDVVSGPSPVTYTGIPIGIYNVDKMVATADGFGSVHVAYDRVFKYNPTSLTAATVPNEVWYAQFNFDGTAKTAQPTLVVSRFTPDWQYFTGTFYPVTSLAVDAHGSAHVFFSLNSYLGCYIYDWTCARAMSLSVVLPDSTIQSVAVSDDFNSIESNFEPRNIYSADDGGYLAVASSSDIAGNIGQATQVIDSTLVRKTLTFTEGGDKTIYIKMPKSTSSVSANFDITGVATSSYPTNPSLSFGEEGIMAWNFTGSLEGKVNTGDISSAMMAGLIENVMDANGYRRVPMTMHSDTAGTLVISSFDIVLNNCPIADAGNDILSGNAEAQFDGSMSFDTDGTIVAYDWEFGDGTTGTGMMASHIYAEDGSYDVILKVTDNDGLIGTDTIHVIVDTMKPVLIITSPTRNDPIFRTGGAFFEVSYIYDEQNPAMVTVELIDPSSLDVIAGPYIYTDNFGTHVVTLPTPEQIPDKQYHIRVLMYDALGRVGGDVEFYTIVIDNQPPIAEAGPDITINPGEMANLDGSASTDNNGITMYEWTIFDFRYGTTIVYGEIISYLFELPGDYSVTLIVYDGAGNSDSDTCTVHVVGPDLVIDEYFFEMVPISWSKEERELPGTTTILLRTSIRNIGELAAPVGEGFFFYTRKEPRNNMQNSNLNGTGVIIEVTYPVYNFQTPTLQPGENITVTGFWNTTAIAPFSFGVSCSISPNVEKNEFNNLLKFQAKVGEYGEVWQEKKTPATTCVWGVDCDGTTGNWIFVGDAGMAMTYDGNNYSTIETDVTESLYSVAWGSTNAEAYAIGGSGSFIKYSGDSFVTLGQFPSASFWWVDWSDAGAYALAGGNGVLVTYDDLDGLVTYDVSGTYIYGATPYHGTACALLYGRDGYMAIYNHLDGSITPLNSGVVEDIFATGIAPDDSYALITTASGTVYRYDVNTTAMQFLGNIGLCYKISFHPGSEYAMGTGIGAFRYDGATIQWMDKLVNIWDTCWSPSGSYAVGTSYWGSTSIFNFCDFNIPPVVEPLVVASNTDVVTLDATTCFDYDGRIVSYLWDFGFGDVTFEPIVTRIFPGEGAYPVILTVTDNEGAETTETVTVYIDRTAPTVNLVSPTEASPMYVRSFGELVCDYTYTDVSPYSVEFTLYDDLLFPINTTGPIYTGFAGGVGSNTISMPVLDSSIKYTLRIKMTDWTGLVGYDSEVECLIVDNEGPVAEAGLDKTLYTRQLVIFAGMDSTDNIGITDFWWYFPDTATWLYGSMVFYSFNKVGVFEVELWVVDAAGNEAMDICVVTVLGTVLNVETGETFATIQEAIDDVETLDGHTLEVMADIYYEDVVVNKSLSIIGLDMPIIFGSGTCDVVTAESASVAISGFTITAAGAYSVKDPQPMSIWPPPPPVRYAGIELNYAAGCTIENNVISVGPNNWGIHLYYSDMNAIENNTCNGNYHGLLVDYSTGNKIANNTFTGNEGDGVVLSYSLGNLVGWNNLCHNYYGIFLAWSDGNTLAGNDCSYGLMGIRLHNSSHNAILRNNCSWNSAYGIVFYYYDCNYNVLEFNMISNNTSGGIWMYSSDGNTISHNEISWNGCGIALYNSNDNQIFRNNFVGNVEQAYDAGSNIWNLADGGNYWSDWNSPDADADGFVDVPRAISGGTNSDMLALVIPESWP